VDEFEWAANLNPNPYKKRMKAGLCPVDYQSDGKHFRIVNGELRAIPYQTRTQTRANTARLLLGPSRFDGRDG
jgi:hypothetical protein